MELITTETTLEAFSNQNEWIVQEPRTGVIYQTRMAMLADGECYLYVIQSGREPCPTYVRASNVGSVIITGKAHLLDTLQRKQFYID